MSDTTYKSKVGYNPPVELEYHEGTPEIKSVWDNMRDAEGKILGQVEEHVVAQCSVAVGVKIDRDELIKALRYDRCQYEKGYEDGKRDAIESLQAEQKKTVTQIFGEEQQEWEEYCSGLMGRIRELKAQLPKRGKWLIHSTGGSMATKKCPFCGSESWQSKEYAKVPKYCENCGAHLPTFDIVDWVDYLYAKTEVQE